MTLAQLSWLTAVHIFTFLTWVGSLTGLSFILKQHAKADQGAHSDFLQLERNIAIAMDIGAFLTLVVGSLLLVKIQPSLLKQGGFMHAKLTLVVVLLIFHVVQRVRVGKNKRGSVSPEPGWLIPSIEISVAMIIVLITVRPF